MNEWSFNSGITLFQKVLGSIPGSIVGFSLLEYYFTVWTGWVFMYIIVLYCAVFGEGPCTLLTTGQGRRGNFVCIPCGPEKVPLLEGVHLYVTHYSKS